MRNLERCAMGKMHTTMPPERTTSLIHSDRRTLRAPERAQSSYRALAHRAHSPYRACCVVHATYIAQQATCCRHQSAQRIAHSACNEKRHSCMHQRCCMHLHGAARYAVRLMVNRRHSALLDNLCTIYNQLPTTKQLLCRTWCQHTTLCGVVCCPTTVEPCVRARPGTCYSALKAVTSLTTSASARHGRD